MARPRKLGNNKAANNNGTSSSSESNESISSPTLRYNVAWKLAGFFCFLVAVYVGSLGYLETRVNTPFDDEKVVQKYGLAVPEKYWGTYRPGVYFGLKNREPWAIAFGLMWYEPTASHKGIRHWCDQSDNLSKYGWQRHDGETFGEQIIVDSDHTLRTSFIKTNMDDRGGQWTARVEVSTKGNRSQPFTLIWYTALDEPARAGVSSRIWLEDTSVLGYSNTLDNFKVSLHTHKGHIIHKSFTEANVAGLHVLKEKVYSLFKAANHPKLGRHAVLGPDPDLQDRDKDVNFIVSQLLVETPFALDIVYTTDEVMTTSLKGDEYTKELEEKRKQFDLQFEDKFRLEAKGYKEEDIIGARAALSNMIGGLSYVYGASRVRSAYTAEPVPYWRAPLFTAVPSRSFFPRGFLWDEGFHSLLLGRWSPDVQLDITAHWLDLINVEGWIPREQILGQESLARVPKEFVVQTNAAANPPMLLLSLSRLVTSHPALFESDTEQRRTLDRMFSRLQAWYQWYQNTQKGHEPTSYRWRGRQDDGKQLNPKTLTSGLDDYPRASHPTKSERHVDLRCWMYAANDAMYNIARVLRRDTAKYELARDQLGDEDALNELHWSPHTGTYADYGLHTDGVRLVRQQPMRMDEQPSMVRSVTVPPQMKLVTSAYGYVSLFPMLLRVLKPESNKLGRIFEDLDRPELLWSPYGLRSLSKSSPMYMKRNTEHDPPYWRGQVWININYLALSSLKHYSDVGGPYAERAGQLYERLRRNVVGNVMAEYKRTGYFWEQYSGENGQGSGCKPFTGWTALVTLIMAEEY